MQMCDIYINPKSKYSNKMGDYRMRIKISTCYISWMVQAVDVIDYDHGDDLNELMDAC